MGKHSNLLPMNTKIGGCLRMFHIVIAEDDDKLNELFSTVLTQNGYKVFSAFDGKQALDIMDVEYIDLVISDIMMPNIDGYELTKMLRDAKYQTPILFITAKELFADKEKGFLLGIDDYMVKPIDVNEMLLRVKALLRRAKLTNEKKIKIGTMVFDYDAFTVKMDNTEELLPQKEFSLIYKLLSSPNRIFTRQELMDEIWGMESESDDRTVAVHINRLRDRFKSVTDFSIVTIRGLGYKAVILDEE